jgi:AcrR family transcriptional regulator
VADAARKLFVERGFHNTGMAQIADASCVKVGQIYRDFSCKEAIVAAIVEEQFGSFLDTDALRDAIARGDRVEVRAALARFFDYSPAARMMPEILAEAARNVRIADVIRSLDARLEATVRAALIVFAPGERFERRRDDVAQVLMTLAIGLCQRNSHAAAPVDESIADILRGHVAREIDALEAAAADPA